MVDKELNGLEKLAAREAMTATPPPVTPAFRLEVGARVTVGGREFKIVYLRPDRMTLEPVDGQDIGG